MVTIGMNYQVLPGKNDLFESSFANVLTAMRGIEGHGESRLLRDVTDTQYYLIVSEWTSEEAFREFVRSEEFAKVTNWGKEQILAGRPSHKVYKHS